MDEESFRMQVGIFGKVALSEFGIWRFGRRVGNAKKDRMREEHPLGNPSGPPCRTRLDLVEKLPKNESKFKVLWSEITSEADKIQLWSTKR